MHTTTLLENVEWSYNSNDDRKGRWKWSSVRFKLIKIITPVRVIAVVKVGSLDLIATVTICRDDLFSMLFQRIKVLNGLLSTVLLARYDQTH